MPFFFSGASLKRIEQLHPDLQRVLKRAMALQVMDFTVVCTLRNEADQNREVAEGQSRTPFPKSKHNAVLNVDGTKDFTMASAFDLAPYPVAYPDAKTQTNKEYTKRIGAFFKLAGVIMSAAVIEGVPLKWGGTWPTLQDYPHFELDYDRLGVKW